MNCRILQVGAMHTAERIACSGTISINDIKETIRSNVNYWHHGTYRLSCRLHHSSCIHTSHSAVPSRPRPGSSLAYIHDIEDWYRYANRVGIGRSLDGDRGQEKEGVCLRVHGRQYGWESYKTGWAVRPWILNSS